MKYGIHSVNLNFSSRKTPPLSELARETEVTELVCNFFTNVSVGSMSSLECLRSFFFFVPIIIDSRVEDNEKMCIIDLNSGTS